jgi:cobalt-precorrin-5B (C1)-methyltransferase
MAKTNAEMTKQLRRGWTTGACATAATKAAFTALLTGQFPDPVSITLPKGQTPSFALCLEGKGADWAQAGIVKDAGDDPDVTHGATIIATVTTGQTGAGIVFRAGEGVGMVTMDGLPVSPGEPAINPVPRRMMTGVIEQLASEHGVAPDVVIEISVPGGAALAEKTWNPRLGIVGGLSILGTTGIVNPFSCSAWIASIHRGIDVARAAGIGHVAGATGSTSEAAVKALYGLPDQALIDMGDFVGGMLKYLRDHPVDRVSVAGGFGKLTKMAQGAMDLHSGRSQVDFEWLADRVEQLGGNAQLLGQVRSANTAKQVFDLTVAAGLDVAAVVAEEALRAGRKVLRNDDAVLDIVVVDRDGRVIGRAG